VTFNQRGTMTIILGEVAFLVEARNFLTRGALP
jgi:hypothetical protein